MTRENERLRGKLKAVEDVAVRYLSSQPADDDRCREHLMSALEKIAAELDSCGCVEVCASRIVWDGGLDLPSTATVRVRDGGGLAADQIAEALSSEYKAKVKSFDYWLAT